MPDIDVIDSSWIGAPPDVVGSALAEPSRWRRWWPGFDLRVSEQRGPKGVRWVVRSADGGRDVGRLVGTMEVWLEPVFEGVVAHYFLRLDPCERRVGGLDRATVEQLVHRFRLGAKKAMWALADELDPGRLARVAAPRR